MTRKQEYQGGENFDLREMLLRGRHMKLFERTEVFAGFLGDLEKNQEMLCLRCITSAADREVQVIDPVSGQTRPMVMFGSNNYLGLATHPHLLERATEAFSHYGAGVGGPPLLNGYTALHKELEERLARTKGAEDALLFSSGYAANVGLVTGLMQKSDLVLYDAYSHASLSDGIKMAGVPAQQFTHNDIAQLRRMLEAGKGRGTGDTYVAVEGVYSMDGDLAPLKELSALCRSYGAILIVDDAHGTGVLGAHGNGTAEHFGVEQDVPLTVGTFSKTFAITGGFIAGPKRVIDYLRFFARAYMFSASLSPASIATVMAALDVLEQEPERLWRLRQNVAYAAASLRRLGFDVHPEAAIIPLRVPEGMDIRRASRLFHELGIFVNSIEYPAVPISQQRFRISIMATHTGRDIDRLVAAVRIVWASCAPGSEQSPDMKEQLHAA
jgi:glycine C-acetyltransferase